MKPFPLVTLKTPAPNIIDYFCFYHFFSLEGEVKQEHHEFPQVYSQY